MHDLTDKREVQARFEGMKHCTHDFENAKHPSRATWICPKCNEDISLEFVLWWEAVYFTCRACHKPFLKEDMGRSQDTCEKCCSYADDGELE